MMVVLDMNNDFDDRVPPWVAFATSTDKRPTGKTKTFPQGK